MPYFHYPLLEALVHDVESSLSGNAMLITIIGNRHDHDLFTRRYPD